MPPTLLLIDDDASLLRLLQSWMDREGWRVHSASNGAEGLRSLSETLPDVIVLDLYLAGEDGLEILDRIVARHPNIPVVMLTAEAGVNVVVEAMRRGAHDYLTKPMARSTVIDTVRKALAQTATIQRSLGATREAGGGGFGAMLGQSPAMLHLFRQLDRVAPSEVTVLIQGESGTGKELVARAIHDGSSRSKGPFIAVNCAAIPESLQESELFGHEKGAFTGAEGQRAGRFEQAQGGTLFLDELGELSASLQAKLLRALQERRFYRVGGNTEVKVDVRILAATHKDLEAAVQAGTFREDLFYRLAVFEVELPPLRDRGDDILLLAKHLLSTKPGGRNLTLASDAERILRTYSWPGNVRELDNAMARAAVCAEGQITAADLPQRVKTGPPTKSTAVDEARSDDLKPMELLERQAIVDAMAAAEGNHSAVMRQLGIARTTFYRKLKKYGLDG